MRPNVFAPVMALTLSLAGCNANQPPPSIGATQPPELNPNRIVPRAAPEDGCAADIARYRAIQDNDLAMGHVNKDVYAQIQSEIGEAERACTAGDQLRARYLLRASKERHGYPTG